MTDFVFDKAKRCLDRLSADPRAQKLARQKTLAQQVYRIEMGEARAEAEAIGVVKGEAKGRASSVLRVLEARGIDVPDRVRERIVACQDTEQLDRWLTRAATVQSAEELLD